MQKWRPPVPPSLKRIPSFPCLSSRCVKITTLIFSYSLVILKTAAFVLGPVVSENTCEPFKRRISIPYSPMSPSDVSSIGFVSSDFGGLSLQYRSKGLRLPAEGHKSLVPPREALDNEIPSLLWVTVPGWGLVRLHLCLSYLPHSIPFILCCREEVQLVFIFFFSSEGIAPNVAADLVCLREEVSSGSSCTAILNFPLVPSLLMNCSTTHCPRCTPGVFLDFSQFLHPCISI